MNGLDCRRIGYVAWVRANFAGPVLFYLFLGFFQRTISTGE
jgi:hypothetical protein